MSERTIKLLIAAAGVVTVGLVLLLLGLTIIGPPRQPNLKAGPSGAPSLLMTESLWKK